MLVSVELVRYLVIKLSKYIIIIMAKYQITKWFASCIGYTNDKKKRHPS